MILITGGFGFIGQNLARLLIGAGVPVALTRFRTSVLPPDLELHRGKQLTVVDLDLREPWGALDLLKRLGVTQIVHLATAGWTGSVSADHTANVGGLLTLLEAAHRTGVRRFVAASSIAVYADAAGPYREDQPLSVELPANGPGCLKRGEEIAGGYFGAATGLEVVFARIGIVYGPGYRSMRNLLSRIASSIARGTTLNAADQLPPYADYTHVADIAAGLAAMATKASLAHAVYNLGHGRGLNRDELILEAARQGLNAAGLTQLATLSGWPTENFMDVRRAAADFDYRPSLDLAAGLADYIKWLK